MAGPRPRRLRRFGIILTALALPALGQLGVPSSAAAAAPTWHPGKAPITTPWTADVSPTNALREYPRPQLTRTSWQNLNGVWEFAGAAAGAAPPFGRSLPERVLVPYPIESALSGIARHEDHMFYRRSFTVPYEWRKTDPRILLHFGAVDYQARVWVNGSLVASHTGGYEKFDADITAALRSGSNEIVVGVTDTTDGTKQPIGKQHQQPGGIYYTPSSGIWQTVWIEPVATAHVVSLQSTPDVPGQQLRLTPEVTGAGPGATVEAVASRGSQPVATASGAPGSQLTLKIANPRLWSPSDPYLYQLTVRVRSAGKVVDTVGSYVGMRSVGLVNGPDGKERIAINGKATFVMATLDQGFWPDGLYTAPTDGALKFDLQQHKVLGFNAVRKHIKVEPDRWYYWADKLGLLVWQDVPALDLGVRADAQAQAALAAERTAIIDQHKSWTSIMGWIPFNEGWGEWSSVATGDIADEVKAQDPSRLVDAHSGVNCCFSLGDAGKGDIVDWHQYTGPATPQPETGRAAIDGEHGGFGLVEKGHDWPGPPGSYQFVNDSAALTKAYVANQERLLQAARVCGVSGGIYTQITDVENELNGLWTYDRRVEKVDSAKVRAVNQELITKAEVPVPPADADPGTPGLGGTHAWDFSEGSGSTAADGVGSDDLTLTGQAGWSTGPTTAAGSALQLDGDGDSAEAATAAVDTTGSFSVAAWVKLDRIGGFSTAVSQDGDAASAFFLQYSAADGRFAFSTAAGRALATAAPEAGRWYHLVGARDASAGTYTLFVDGQRQGSVQQCLGDPTTGTLAVGRGKFNGGPVDYWPGAIDQVRTYDRALSDGEVATLHDAG